MKHNDSVPAGEFISVAPSVKLGKDVKLGKFINLYGCEIGDETKIGAFVEIQKNACVGRRCKISSHTFICEGVTIEATIPGDLLERFRQKAKQSVHVEQVAAK